MPPLSSFRAAYTAIIGKSYSNLSDKEKRTVYAMEVYRSSNDILTAFDIYSSRMDISFIDDLLRNRLGYTNDSFIRLNKGG